MVAQPRRRDQGSEKSHVPQITKQIERSEFKGDFRFFSQAQIILYSRLFYYFYAHFSNKKQIWNYSYNLYPLLES
jgi:hypothetical protein